MIKDFTIKMTRRKYGNIFESLMKLLIEDGFAETMRILLNESMKIESGR
ncbi:hypothetical protein [Sedimentisphaera salicampi]|nr:hypothetical protein [Sedimentisphaera salicampi]